MTFQEMHFSDFYGLMRVFENIDEEHVMRIDPGPFIWYNVYPDGFMGDQDAVFAESFAAYAESNYELVAGLSPYDGTTDEECGIVIGENYTFAVPMDAEIPFDVICVG